MVVPMARLLLMTILLAAPVWLTAPLCAAPPVEDSATLPVPVAPAPTDLSLDEALPEPGGSPFDDEPPPLQDDRFPDPPGTFIAIELTPEGVLATDTLGDDWMYDFNRERFVPVRRLPRDDRGEETVRPVEERALTKLEVKSLASTVNVGYDEYVADNIRATGRVVVRGWVQGNIQSLTEVLVLPTGQVDGDIRAPNIEVKQGGVVLGRQEISSISPDYLTDSIAIEGTWFVVGCLVLLLIIAFILHYLAQPQLTRIRSCMRQYRTKSLAMGALLVLLLGPAAAVLAITIIGLIPAVLLIVVAYPLAMAVGILLVGQTLAALSVFRFLSRKPSVIVLSLTGILMLGLLWLVVIELAESDSTSQAIMAGFGLLIAIPITAYAACAGLGASFLTRFGYRDYISFRDRQKTDDDSALAPAPPPIPKAPPVVKPPSENQRSARSGPSPLSSGNE